MTITKDRPPTILEVYVKKTQVAKVVYGEDPEVFWRAMCKFLLKLHAGSLAYDPRLGSNKKALRDSVAQLKAVNKARRKSP